MGGGGGLTPSRSRSAPCREKHDGARFPRKLQVAGVRRDEDATFNNGVGIRSSQI